MYVRAFERLADIGPRAVVADVLFAGESEPTTDAELARFAKAINVLVVAAKARPAGRPSEAAGADLPFAGLLRAGVSVGHIEMPPDLDGVYRRYAPFVRVGEGLVPTLALRTLLDLNTGVSPRTDPGTITFPDIPGRDGQPFTVTLRPDRAGNVPIEVPGLWESTFSHVPVHVLLRPRKDIKGLSQKGRSPERDQRAGEVKHRKVVPRLLLPTDQQSAKPVHP
jgi:hypothetical protein